MSRARWAGSVALGLALFALPFLRYAHLGDASAPHSDHRPRNGGVLRMVGDHHLEVRRGQGRVEVFVSDAVRKPVRARGGWVTFADSGREPLRAGRDRLTARDRPDSDGLRVDVELDDDRVLSWEFDAIPSG